MSVLNVAIVGFGLSGRYLQAPFLVANSGAWFLPLLFQVFFDLEQQGRKKKQYPRLGSRKR